MSWSQRIRKAAGQMLGRKFIVRRAAAMAVLLFLAFGFTACRRDFTVAYLYVTASSAQGAGFINGYQVDYQTGALVKTAGSPYAAGAKPVALVTTNDGLFVYVVNQDDNTVQEFAVHMGDGSLTSLNTYPTGNMPTSIAIDSANKFLYVTFTYWDGSSGTGGVDIFPINPDNSLGTPLAPVPVGNNPVGIAASRFFNLVYVVDSESPNTTSARGVILGFNQDPSTGALTPTPATSITGPGGQTVATGFKAGVRPSAIAIAPVSRFVYVTDRATNQLYSNIIGNSGDLTEIVTSPNPTGNLPLGITIDPRSLYLYVSNYNSNNVSAFVINPATGSLTGTLVTAGANTGTGPMCVAIEPALGLYVYSANFLDNSVSGMKLDATNGALKTVVNSPFEATGSPTCAAAVANGSHATTNLTP